MGRCTGRRSGERGVLWTWPAPCIVTEYTIVYHVEREKLEYERRDGFCVSYAPFRAVWPARVCDLLDDVMAGRARSRALLGPGGTGKTLVLETLRRAAPFNTLDLEAERLLKPYVGQSEEALYNTLAECEESEPCLLLADEGDILLRGRFVAGGFATGSGTVEVSSNLIRILLRRLQQWYNERRNLGIIVASNMPASMIEKPLLRAGRLGEPIYFPLPDRRAIRLLAELYNVRLGDDEVEMLLRLAIPHSNVVEYLLHKRLERLEAEAFAGFEYADYRSRPQRTLQLPRGARVVIAEDWAVGVKLAALISTVEYGKPVVYLRDPMRLHDAESMGRSTELPIAIPYTPYTATAHIALYGYPHTVFYIGNEWSIPYMRITLADVIRVYGVKTVLEAFCGDAKSTVSIGRAKSMIQQCISGIKNRL